MHGASSGGSTPDLTSLDELTAAVDDVGSVSEKFYQQAATGQYSVHSTDDLMECVRDDGTVH